MKAAAIFLIILSSYLPFSNITCLLFLLAAKKTEESDLSFFSFFKL